jgi:hypothetical protein
LAEPGAQRTHQRGGVQILPGGQGPDGQIHTEVLNTAYTRNPERFVRKPPEPPTPPTTVWINSPSDQDEQQAHSKKP